MALRRRWRAWPLAVLLTSSCASPQPWTPVGLVVSGRTATPLSAGWPPPDSVYGSYIVDLDRRDPAMDLAANWARGERRLAALRGFVSWVPGLDALTGCSAHVAATLERPAIGGEGRMPTSDGHGIDLHAVHRYAMTYNQLLIAKLMQEAPCPPAS